MDDLTHLHDNWFKISNPEEINSPALLIYPDRIEHNIRKMIETVADVSLLRPHIKTHKMAGVVRLQMKHGISRFKCATISEAEMASECGAGEVMLALQPVGPNIGRLIKLINKFPGTIISCISDCSEVTSQLSEDAVRSNTVIHVWLDINNGMNRTGVSPDKSAVDLYRLMTSLPMLVPEGLHVYDGHIHESETRLREEACNEAFAPVGQLASDLMKMNGTSLKVVAGGTPTFPIHAKRKGVETSPGTTLLWDYGYSSSFSAMRYLNAAVLFTRIISKPSNDLICIDLGHKAVASEMPQPRVWFPEIVNYKIISHNEEHMVIKTDRSYDLKTGQVLYGIPYHICPTVDRFDAVSVVMDGKVTGEWNVEARKRKITI